ncbi:oligoribonuclease, mitochondrial-like [Brevipalpus obovatus]|uniref:oligoribonuclease, mitochondrial-like n=1 Tax=Brevipalpus obovatus TaxID=246614 RepID=UPI003D9E696D
MNDWCKKSHRKSGLWKACLESQMTIEDVDNQLSQILAEKCIQVAALAGNSVSFDRMFLKKYCPKFGSLLHYRMVDVSTIKELVRRWYPNEPNHSKKLNHRALDDIRESIDELRYYRARYFKTSNQLD